MKVKAEEDWPRSETIRRVLKERLIAEGIETGEWVAQMALNNEI